jgi:hypothetical protein
MGLTSWDGSPESKIHKYDVSVAKNYLSENELQQLQRIVSAYLDMAEMQAIRQIPMTMADWEERLNRFLSLMDREILMDAGRVTAELAKQHAESEFEKYRIILQRLEMDYHYQGKTDAVAEFKISDSWLQSMIYVPLASQDAVVVICEVKVYDVKGNHLTTGRAHWQIKNWAKVKTQVTV